MPQSPAEAETAAYAKAAKDVRYVTNIVGSDGFQLKLSLPINFNCDNQAAVSSIKNAGSTARNRGTTSAGCSTAASSTST